MGLLSKGRLRIFLTLTNFIFFVIGAVCIGVGAWQAIDKIFISDVIGSEMYSTATYLVIFSGCVIVIISCVGCVGAIMQNRPIIVLYMVTVVLIVILLIAAGAVAAAFKGQLGSDMINNMKTSIREKYGNQVQSNADNKRITKSWDTLQVMLQCCGVDNRGWGLYRSSEWFKQVNPNNHVNHDSYTIFVPASCCKYQGAYQSNDWLPLCQRNPLGPPRYLEDTHENQALIYKGCSDAAKEFVNDNIGVLIAAGFVFGFLMIAGLVFGFLLYRSLSKPFVPVSTREH